MSKITFLREKFDKPIKHFCCVKFFKGCCALTFKCLSREQSHHNDDDSNDDDVLAKNSI